MIRAYIDESGIHDGASVCVVAGYFGGQGKWRKFETAWKQMLRDFKVPMEKFHANRFYPEPKPGSFFCDEWKGDYKKFQWAIADLIAANTKLTPVSHGLLVPDFWSFSVDERRFMTGARKRNGKLETQGCPDKPYFVPFQYVVSKICKYATVGSKAHFFFGIDRPFYNYATVLFKQMETDELREGSLAWKQRLGKPEAPKAANTAQLQVADFMVNLTYHHMIDTGANCGRVPPAPLLDKCLQNRRCLEDFQFSTAETLRRTLSEFADLEKYLAAGD